MENFVGNKTVMKFHPIIKISRVISNYEIDIYKIIICKNFHFCKLNKYCSKIRLDVRKDNLCKKEIICPHCLFRNGEIFHYGPELCEVYTKILNKKGIYKGVYKQ